MSNSSLVNYTALSPNHYSGRNHAIDKITVHHMAGNLTVEQCGNVFANANANASSNYGIGTDGRVGLYVDESNAAWTSSNYANDNRAITIEVANDGQANWHVSDTAYEALINLCVDICRRNCINGLSWTGDASGTLTCHYMFAATSCPGDYLKSKMPDIAARVNSALNTTPSNDTTKKVDDLQAINIPSGGGDVYRLYNKNNGQHMFTTSASERDGLVKAGWTNEGAAWKSADTGAIVYRLYNGNTGDHMFTASFDEAKSLTDAGWTYEGGNFADARSGVAVYRLYNASNGQHTFTKDATERDNLVKAGWKNEGVAFYGA